METTQARITEVHKALAEFIINATKKDAPSYAVQALPEAVREFVRLGTSFDIRD